MLQIGSLSDSKFYPLLGILGIWWSWGPSRTAYHLEVAPKLLGRLTLMEIGDLHLSPHQGRMLPFWQRSRTVGQDSWLEAGMLGGGIVSKCHCHSLPPLYLRINFPSIEFLPGWQQPCGHLRKLSFFLVETCGPQRYPSAYKQIGLSIVSWSQKAAGSPALVPWARVPCGVESQASHRSVHLSGCVPYAFIFRCFQVPRGTRQALGIWDHGSWPNTSPHNNVMHMCVIVTLRWTK